MTYCAPVLLSRNHKCFAGHAVTIGHSSTTALAGAIGEQADASRSDPDAGLVPILDASPPSRTTAVNMRR
ncbi:hypothetical protein B0I31_120104 [Saccharothrix carnea]|uniref:Uncharacterized protein n=1 Tax=Saccharothrix carnea TaxID=1280637 RepID=A0A2P8HZB4_SACCR|nr:hypothetical protein [Saccharothrix carnea]PSL51570.1 hypothetical protein B0I31_120104 [Saccharothrix carnea]